MAATQLLGPIQIGLITAEPIRLEGLRCIFDQPAQAGKPQMIPVAGNLEELLANPDLEYLIIDLNVSCFGLETLEMVRRLRPAIRQIVIGSEASDEVVIDSIIAGARAFLDLSASPELVRTAIESVQAGSIWAPRRVLSKLIDRFLGTPDGSLMNTASRLTSRECQVLEQILLARSNREIALQLGIEERTVKAHVGHLMRKTGSENRIGLTMTALNGSLLTESSGEKIGSGSSATWYVTEE